MQSKTANPLRLTWHISTTSRYQPTGLAGSLVVPPKQCNSDAVLQTEAPLHCGPSGQRRHRKIPPRGMWGQPQECVVEECPVEISQGYADQCIGWKMETRL